MVDYHCVSALRIGIRPDVKILGSIPFRLNFRTKILRPRLFLQRPAPPGGAPLLSAPRPLRPCAPAHPVRNRLGPAAIGPEVGAGACCYSRLGPAVEELFNADANSKIVSETRASCGDFCLLYCRKHFPIRAAPDRPNL